MPDSKTIAMTGATGFVGRSMVNEFIRRGWRVTALVRDREKAGEVLPPAGGDRPLRLVVGDIFNPDAVRQCAAGAAAMVNLIGIIRERPGATFRRLHVDATNAAATACVETGTRRFIQMSALGASDEGVSAYQRTKFEAEQIVRASGLDWTIFRPSLIHGPEGEFMNQVVEWTTGHVPPYVFMPYFTRGVPDLRVPLGSVERVDPVIAPVAVADVSRAFAEAIERPRAIGEVYALSGGETLTWPEFLREVRAHAPGAREKIEPWGIPAELAALAARAAAAAGLGGLLPFDEGMARMGGQDSAAPLDKVRAHLGVEPTKFRPDFRAYAASMADVG